MSRSVWSRVLLLQCCPLTDAHQAGRTQAVIDKYYKGQGTALGVPVSLRWVMQPLYGLPRQPFRLYRRQRSIIDMNKYGKALYAGPVVTSPTGVVIEWGNETMFDVVFKVTPAAGGTVTVRARDDHDGVLPGQSVSFTVAGWGRLRAQGIAALEALGNGTVEAVSGIGQDVLVNLPLGTDWKLVQVVGLPWKPGEIGMPAYDPQPQGLTPAGLSGVDAARQRLEIAAMLQLPCPPVPGAVGAPSWGPPDPAGYLGYLRDGAPGGGASIVRTIADCLKQTKDNDADHLQRDYRASFQLGGIQQLDQGAPAQGKTKMQLPVVGTTMVTVASESFAATGLGFGTVDLPPTGGMSSPPVAGPPPPNYAMPAGTADLAYDYMIVTTVHTLIQFLGSKIENTIELAALAQGVPKPAVPQGLKAVLDTHDRPAAMDQQTAETRRLEWTPTPGPMGYGIAATRPGAQTVFLNRARPAGGYVTYMPARPVAVDGAPPLDASVHFLDRRGAQPFSGNATTAYALIAQDIFGRWSLFAQASFISSAGPVQRPGLEKVAFDPQPGAVADPLPGTLVVDVLWDWADRSPEVIELRGRFFAVDGQAPGAAPAGFALSGGAPGSVLQIKFDATQAPLLEPATKPPGATVSQIAQVKDGGADVRRYRVIIPNVSAGFAGKTQVGYAAYARGSEHKRPGFFSDSVGPRVCYVADPAPPKISVNPPPILWTALPDVSGKARARLTWGGDPKAVGYVVWMTTETALIEKLGLGNVPTDIEARAQLLKDAVLNASSEDEIRVFSRLNDKPLPEPSYEAVLPGSSDRLFFYRISAVSQNAVESVRSAKAFAVAVPRRIEPGQPRILLRAVPGQGIEVTVTAGAPPQADGYRLFRCRGESLARDVGLMGPAAYAHDAAAWQDTQVELIRGEPRPARVLTDPQPASWFPTYYRAQAVGGSKATDPDHGRYRGESVPSEAASVTLTPVGPPILALLPSVFVDPGDQINIFTIHSDLPDRLSPLGPAYFEIFDKDQKIFGKATHEIPAQTTLPPKPTAAEVWQIAQAGISVVYYKSPTNIFPPQYRVYIKTHATQEQVLDVATGDLYWRPIVGDPRRVRLTDPLRRQTEVALVQKLTPKP